MKILTNFMCYFYHSLYQCKHNESPAKLNSKFAMAQLQIVHETINFFVTLYGT